MSPKWPKNPSPPVDGFARPYVAEAAALGVDLTFPRAPLLRLQAVQWLVTLLHLAPATMQNPCTDVPDVLAAPILSAVQAGIVRGTSPSTFDPLGEVTSTEFSAMLFSSQLASQGSCAVVVGGATYFSRDGLTLVHQDADDWTLLAGSAGLRPVAGALRPVKVQGKGTSLLVTEILRGDQSEVTISESGSPFVTLSGESVSLPAGVPAAAGWFNPAVDLRRITTPWAKKLQDVAA